MRSSEGVTDGIPPMDRLIHCGRLSRKYPSMRCSWCILPELADEMYLTSVVNLRTSRYNVKHFFEIFPTICRYRMLRKFSYLGITQYEDWETEGCATALVEVVSTRPTKHEMANYGRESPAVALGRAKSHLRKRACRVDLIPTGGNPGNALSFNSSSAYADGLLRRRGHLQSTLCPLASYGKP
jgi:hypothetical protein